MPNDEIVERDEDADLRKLMEMPIDNIPEMPDLPPDRHFYAKLLGISAGTKQTGTKFYRFDAQITRPGEDVKQEELRKIADAGISLSDYGIYAEFFLTPKSIQSRFGLKVFVKSLGFDGSKSFPENLALEEETWLPTEKSQQAVRGREVLVGTKKASDGKVYNRVDSMVGLHKSG